MLSHIGCGFALKLKVVVKGGIYANELAYLLHELSSFFQALGKVATGYFPTQKRRTKIEEFW